MLADVKTGADSTATVRNIDTSITDSLVPGAPLVNLFGDLVGISTSASKLEGGVGAFVSVSDILGALSATRASSTPSR
jgi:hypothetical protein